MARLICENCGHGSHPKTIKCEWCGAGSHVMHMSDAVTYMDVECYPNWFLVRFSTGEMFELFEDTTLDVVELKKTLSRYTVYTFNGRGYDIPMIELALKGATCYDLKQLSDDIIQSNKKWWQLKQLPWLDHVDMLEVSPGAGSQKMYGAKMHMPVLQDLPYDPAKRLDWYEIMQVRDYCGIDIDTLKKLTETLHDAVGLRKHITETTGVDVRSRSGAQAAEAVYKATLPGKVYPPVYPDGYSFYFRPAEWMGFIDLPVLQLLAAAPFTITTAAKNGKDRSAPRVAMHESLESLIITIGNTHYQMGAGGLHSKEESTSHVADDAYSLSDFDIASMYPASIINTGIYPTQLGIGFRKYYKQQRDERISDKKAGRSQDADLKKLFLNSVFGKLFEGNSCFYAPTEGIQVTLTGQVSMLMLIEQLEAFGISVVSANTDGIVIKCRRDMHWLRDKILKEWEQLTDYELESTDYLAIYSRDVNNYLAIKPNGTVKKKGIFADPTPTASNWPAPSGQVCVDAICAYLTRGAPMAETIYACSDIRQFVYVRAVKGGGSFTRKEQPKKNPSKRYLKSLEMTEEDYEQLMVEAKTGWEYLGKTVRWYHSTDPHGSIRTPSGGLVATTEGCSPCMILPDELPDDLNHEWYIAEAEKLLKLIGG